MLFFLVTLSGCGRVVQWGKDNFYQGEDVKKYSQVSRDYLRSVVAYDQFMTQAVFDAIWLSDAVRTAYVDLFALRTGKSDEQKNMLLRRELEENNHYITFYVLSLYNIPLGDPLGDWSVYLKIDDAIYQPTEIKYVDLNSEFQSFFGRFFSRFKTPYQVKFDARDVDCNPIITPKVNRVQLYFRSIKKEVQLTWNVDATQDSIMIKKPIKPSIVREKSDARKIIEEDA